MKNVLLEPWSGPVGGLPAFDRVRIADLKPALETAMDEYRGELARITADPAAPTFDNVIGALDRAGQTLERVSTYYRTWLSTMKDDEVRALEAEMQPKLAGLSDEFVQNAALFAKLERVRDESKDQSLTEEQRRVIELRHLHFVLRGARLNPAEKARVAEINQRLSKLATAFNDHVLKDEEQPALIISNKRELDGLEPGFVAAARAEAVRLGHPDAWVITNTRSSAEIFLTFARDRQARRLVFEAWTARGEATNYPIAREMLALRAERAALYGFATHAHWKLADKMIRTPEAAIKLMMDVWTPAVARVRRDVAQMQQIIAREGGEFQLAAWDYRYYAEKLRRELYDLDVSVLRPYMRFEYVRDAMFDVAERLYQLKFKPLGGVPIYHPDVTVFEVTRGTEVIGVFYLDPFARPGKSSGAWMNFYRPQARTAGTRRPPVVSNNSNFIKAGTGEPTLLSWDDARTMFHEFGHALHGLNSDVTYTYVQGTSVPTDYVEFPSHFHENFLGTPEVLAHFRNADGEPLPTELVAKLNRARTFNTGFANVEFLAPALVDMRLHLAKAGDDVDPEALTADLLTEIGMPAEIVMRHRLPHFAHIFAGDHYSAGYYSYLWSDVIASDAFDAFLEAGDAFAPDVAARLLKHVLSVGGSVEPGEGYRRFRGRDAHVGALLRARGLTGDA